MDVWKQDAKRIVAQEIDAKSDEMGQILLNGLDARIQERTDGFTQQMKQYVEDQVGEQIEKHLKAVKKERLGNGESEGTRHSRYLNWRTGSDCGSGRDVLRMVLISILKFFWKINSMAN